MTNEAEPKVQGSDQKIGSPEGSGSGEGAGGGIIQNFLTYSKDLPSPEVFRLWAAIHAVGAAAERRCWTEFGLNKLYPNLFIFLVGPPGVGKTQAINPMSNILRKSQAVGIAPNDLTKQGLLDALSAFSKGALIDGKPFDYHFMALCIAELSNFMSKYDLELAGLLTDLFDCPPINEEKKRSHDKGKPIPFPGISFIMGTATQNLGNTISTDMWGSGFMARVIMVYSADEVVPEDMFARVDTNEDLGQDIANALRRVGELKGPMMWTREAQGALHSFRLNQKDGAPIHNRLTFYVTRRWLHLAKLCMISALSEERMTVTLDDYLTAKAWLESVESQMPEIFKDMASHEDGQIFEEMRTHFFMIHLKSGKKPIPITLLYQYLSSRTATHNIGRMIEVALAADMFRRVAGTSGDDTLLIPQSPTGTLNLGAL